MVGPERFERPTPSFVAKCSIQLSYGPTAGQSQYYYEMLIPMLRGLIVENFSGFGIRITV